ncbi:hypothetical protein BD414DRAFT_517640 [Trametes punicea]|nr:hypothetical protein BD414DRAFT_517640 [Trametes punicea]
MTFERDPTALLADEFRRLALINGWGKKSVKYKNERKEFYGAAVSKDFAAFWGTTESRLDAWQDLCRLLGFTEIPTSIKKCKQAMKGVYVNLVDLVDSKRTNTQPKTFTSAGALASYIRKTGKIFPKERAKANPLLRQFLVVVFD